MRTYAKNKKEAIKLATTECKKEFGIQRISKNIAIGIKLSSAKCCCGETESIIVTLWNGMEFVSAYTPICSYCAKYNNQ